MHSEMDIGHIYTDSLENAVRLLGNLAVARGRRPSFKGLSGWIFEQTILSCLEDDFSLQMPALPVAEQVSLKGRAKVDLLFGKAAIEIKAAGFFGDESEKYRRYRLLAEDTDLTYLYVTLHESYKPYYEAAIRVFGERNAFFLHDSGAWRNFVSRVAEVNGLTMPKIG